MRKYIVPEEAEGLRLDVFLSRKAAGASRSQVQKLIGAGGVSVEGKKAPKRYTVSAGDVIRLDDSLLQCRESRLEPQNIPLAVIYEDEWYIAVDKPAGLVVHPGSGNWNGTLVNALLFHRGKNLSDGSAADRPGIVHRLDKDTSGVIVIAKTNQAHAALAGEFARRSVRKKYCAFCAGRPVPVEGIIDLPVGRSRSDRKKQAAAAGGRASVTEYRIVDYRSGISFVEFMPRTGRTHQIRVHCSARGFPVVGDDLYGGGCGQLKRIHPSDRPFAASLYRCFSRLALHAVSITFTHPFLQKVTEVGAPLPPDFDCALSLFRETLPPVR
ncbi:MAG: RluA family pseudouridine synthase [Chitinispirillaceae bacterium]|nr:RluA family pseudouridine synthase [Chitinispirillaceae bacterium]